MWKILFKMSAAVFGACVVALSAAMMWRNGFVEWEILIPIALLATALFACRVYVLLRAEARRLFIRTELRRRRDRIRALGAAVRELIESMARLSPGDLSLYGTLLQTAGDADTACILTTQGSPNHNVLVQMTDLRLAIPEELKSIGHPPHQFTTARYRLTPFGRTYLARLMPDVMNLRRLLASRNPPD